MVQPSSEARNDLYIRLQISVGKSENHTAAPRSGYLTEDRGPAVRMISEIILQRTDRIFTETRGELLCRRI